ncbi:unnamed protein product [Rhizopus microsporus]
MELKVYALYAPMTPMTPITPMTPMIPMIPMPLCPHISHSGDNPMTLVDATIHSMPLNNNPMSLPGLAPGVCHRTTDQWTGLPTSKVEWEYAIPPKVVLLYSSRQNWSHVFTFWKLTPVHASVCPDILCMLYHLKACLASFRMVYNMS